jgi:hypothetical protein
MERSASWKVLTLGAALTGLSVAGAGVAQGDVGSPDTIPASVSAAPLFNEPRLLASGSGNFGSGHGDWVDWGPGWYNPGGCISATGPFGNVSGSVCI